MEHMAATVIFDLFQFSVLSLIPGFSITFLVFHSFFPAMQWSILFLLPCGLQYYASYVIVFGRFHVSPIHRHDFILSKVCCFCLIHSNNCSLHGSSGPRRKWKGNVKPDAMGEIICLHILQPGSARYYNQGNQVSTLFVGIGIPCTCLNAL